MATNIWQGDVDEDASNASNWSEGIPVANQDIIVPPWATYGITANLDVIASIGVSSFWVQEGFSKNIGTTTGFFRLDITGSTASRFLFEGSSALAKFQIMKTDLAVSFEVRKTGVGNSGQPALQFMSNDVTPSSTVIGKMSIYSGEVSLGPEDNICELGGLTVGERSGQTGAVVYIGKNCRDLGDGALLTLDMNSGTVFCDSSLVTTNQYGGVIEHRGNAITTLNMWGGISRLNNPTGTSGGRVITKLNLRGGTFDNTENPTIKTVTNADLYSGSIQDPLGKLVWTNAVVFKNKMTDVDFDFGPERTVTIA